MPYKCVRTSTDLASFLLRFVKAKIYFVLQYFDHFDFYIKNLLFNNLNGLGWLHVGPSKLIRNHFHHRHKLAHTHWQIACTIRSDKSRQDIFLSVGTIICRTDPAWIHSIRRTKENPKQREREKKRIKWTLNVVLLRWCNRIKIIY